MLKHSLIDAAFQAHEAWLRPFGAERVKRFTNLKKQVAKSGVSESAACEALIGAYLRNNFDQIEPYEKSSIVSPDFRCTHKGKVFFIEVTSLDTEAVAAATWIPDDPNWEGGSVGSIGRRLWTTISGKVRQCAELDGPTLVAVGILHTWVSMDVDHKLAEDTLISDVSYQVPLPHPNGQSRGPGEFGTGLRSALFLAVDEKGVKQVRQRVSGVLVFGLGTGFVNVIGLLNASALRPFDPKLMPSVEFAECQVKDNRPHIFWHNKKSRAKNERGNRRGNRDAASY